MTVLVTGGSCSGKSAYAEKRLLALCPEEKKYYVAAMQAEDEESRERIARHRRARAGKGFCTIEQPVKIQDAAARMETGDRGALLECVSNLVANEMFDAHGQRAGAEVTAKVTEGIALLRKELTHLVIVSNNVFEDGTVYEEGTMAYMRAMGHINRELAAMADEVVEVVAGIPVVIKTEKAADNGKRV